MQVYALSLSHSKGQIGSGLKRISGCGSNFRPPPYENIPGAMRLTGCGSIDKLVFLLSSMLRTPVIDKTGLTGVYDYSLHHSRDGLPLFSEAQGPQRVPNALPEAVDPRAPLLADALEDQLALRLEVARMPITVLVVDSLQPPTPD
jgi:uncharacterized protein (TIGR03435 family)